MDLIDKRDEVLRTFLEYGITDCEWCDLKKSDLADCAEAIVKKLTIPVVSCSSDGCYEYLSHNLRPKEYNCLDCGHNGYCY